MDEPNQAFLLFWNGGSTVFYSFLWAKRTLIFDAKLKYNDYNSYVYYLHGSVQQCCALKTNSFQVCDDLTCRRHFGTEAKSKPGMVTIEF